jgi:hypothetical protein
MNNVKDLIKKIGKYLREVSAVMVGVAITLFSGFWIAGNSEKRDVALYLNLIKLELEKNKDELDYTVKRLQPTIRYADYLRSHDKKSLNPDTIRAYAGEYYNASPIMIQTNAFDMFKSSGNMRLVNDKELLLSIWDSYSNLAELKKIFDGFMQIKVDDMMKESELFSLYDVASLSDEEILKNVPMYKYHVHISAPYLLPQLCEVHSKRISETGCTTKFLFMQPSYNQRLIF